MVYFDIVSNFYLISLSRNHNPMMINKILLVIKFAGIVTIWMTVLLFFLVYFCVVDIPKSIQNFIFEMFLLAVYIIDCAIFFFRKEYEPFVENNSKDESEQSKNQLNLVLLKEPNEEWFAMTDKLPNNSHTYFV